MKFLEPRRGASAYDREMSLKKPEMQIGVTSRSLWDFDLCDDTFLRHFRHTF